MMDKPWASVLDDKGELIAGTWLTACGVTVQVSTPRGEDGFRLRVWGWVSPRDLGEISAFCDAMAGQILDQITEAAEAEG